MSLLRTIAQNPDSTAVFEATHELTMSAMLQAGFPLPFPHHTPQNISNSESQFVSAAIHATPGASTSFALDPRLQQQLPLHHDPNAFDASSFLNILPSTTGEDRHLQHDNDDNGDALEGESGEGDVTWHADFTGHS